jgi:NAD-dependent DNA ligase
MLHDIEETIEPFMPTICPACFERLKIEDDLHLLCNNDSCSGSGVKKLSKGLEILDLKGLGPKLAEKLFAVGFHKIEDVLDLTKFDPKRLIDLEVYKPGKALDSVYETICKLENIDLAKLIDAMQFQDVGTTMSKALAKHYDGQEVDFSGLNKAAVAKMTDESSPERKRVNKVLELLKSRGSNVTVASEKKTEGLITFEMTGEPKPFRLTKKDFYLSIKHLGYEHTSLTKDTKMLVTDDMSSTTGKMTKAKKFGTVVKTYEQVLKELNLL